MKTLYLLRHAKSSWDDPDLADFDRPLNSRGTAAAPFMGETITRHRMAPDLVLSSPAVRARDTAILVREAAGLNIEISYDERIYEANPQTLRLVVASIDDGVGTAMVVGHNPGIEGFIRFLTGRLETVPTAALAVIDLDLESWSEIGTGSGTLRKLIRPKDEMRMLEKGD